MFTFLLRVKRRIRRLLKVQTEARQAQAVTLRSRTLRYLMLVLAAVTISVFYPGEIFYDPLDMPRQGEIAREDVTAPFPITILKSEQQVREEREQIRRYTPFVLDRDTQVVAEAVDRLRQFADLASSLRRHANASRVGQRSDFLDSLTNAFPGLGQTALVKAIDTDVNFKELAGRLSAIYREQIYRVGVMADIEALPRYGNPAVSVREGDRESQYDRSRILDISLANARLTTVLNRIAVDSALDVDFYYNVGKCFILPNLTANPVEYARRVDEALGHISPVLKEINAGDIIVSVRQKVTAEQEEILKEMVQMMRREEAGRGWWIPLMPVLARFILVLAALAALYLFLKYFRPDVAKSNPKLLAIFLVFGFQIFLVFLLDKLGPHSIYIYPVAVLPVMITILFDSEIGILSTFVLAILLGIMHRFSFSLTLVTAVVGYVGCLTSSKVRKRSDFYRIMLSIILSYILLILVVEKLKLTPNDEMIVEMVYGVVVGALSVILVTGVLPVFESLFGITTDTTLLELSDLNHPLLRRLSIEAPGTYHHSISVGNLSESAAEAVGANALLARVGAYYHDIGKIEVPEYFVENQFSVRSKHDALTPSMSAIILSSHVKKGRMLGEEADIPDDVLNFIEEHHGTIVMEYFYSRAREHEGDSVDINKFRYPGPKPQTRETGIAMLADAVEAASRTLDDPKPARIDALIQRIINARFQSGELDECPLTLRDLAGIRKAFTQVLIAAFHHRVKYPGDPKG